MGHVRARDNRHPLRLLAIRWLAFQRVAIRTKPSGAKTYLVQYQNDTFANATIRRRDVKESEQPTRVQEHAIIDYVQVDAP